MALPGSMYVYQGEELGLPEVEDIPAERRQDPMWLRSGGVDPGRDGCRVPLPWAGQRPPFAFSGEGADRPWLDPPDDWGPLTVEAQSDDLSSMLSLYRAGLRLRRTTAALRAGNQRDGDLRWLPSSDSVLAFARGEDFICLVNFGPDPVDLPDGASVLLASSELEGGALPHDSTVWLRQTNPHDPSGVRSPRADTSDRSNQPASGIVPVLRKG
jgi:alpha-glucosidase